MTSIRRRLLVLLGAAVVAAGAAAAVATYLVAREEVNELFDYHMQQIALSLRAHLDDPAMTDRNAAPEDVDFVVEVWNSEGARLYRSRPATDLPLAPAPGFRGVRAGGDGWRVLTLVFGERTVQVAQPLALRYEMAAQIALRVLAPVVLVLALLVPAAWWIVRHGLKPVRDLARAIELRNPDALDPLPAGGSPKEVAPMVGALNRLLARLGAALEAQRRFVADAAHELRTPLAALQLQVRLAERARTGPERDVAMAQLRGGVQRASRLVAQLLALARLEPGAPRPAFETIALDHLAEEVLADLAPLAGARSIDLGLRRDDPAQVHGDPDALRLLLSNVVDNAIRYAPERGTVDVSVSVRGGTALVEVTDTGPGIPPAERERVFDRFHRLATDVPGSGLGLSIVRSIADRHGATVALDDSATGGLKVSIALQRV